MTIGNPKVQGVSSQLSQVRGGFKGLYRDVIMV